MTLVEICLDDVDGARVAEREGADRIELCADLLEGGITPSHGMVDAVLGATSRVGVQVLIRPRGGDFVYSADELRVMLFDIRTYAQYPRVGFVLSGLTASGRIDVPLLSALLSECGGAPVTYSRAFDEVDEQFAALDTLASLGVARVLTGGGPGAAADGRDRLRALVEHAADRITILAGGSVRSYNVAALVAHTRAPEVHLRAMVPAGGRDRTSADEVRAVLAGVGRR
ncbi:copper homeostasis protein CutC [Cryptosporangium aurantiacum]|uniref:PF03932 family protein CutC n=1 Tax=Cryptosporangium aurantiacum TaxID=134849 RepID=A0A1M7TXY4_9ACTN|nr:copper homeostasis protein CutC [Cryptosporangium aurantiacum]SHN75568.1 copper homeostasis protein [Cryptosporangium aurantiacum]